MPKFIVEQYEIHVFCYAVESENRGEAIAKVFNGDCQPLEDKSEYIATADENGMPLSELTEGERYYLDFDESDELVPSIRSVEQINE